MPASSPLCLGASHSRREERGRGSKAFGNPLENLGAELAARTELLSRAHGARHVQGSLRDGQARLFPAFQQAQVPSELREGLELPRAIPHAAGMGGQLRDAAAGS